MNLVTLALATALVAAQTPQVTPAQMEQIAANFDRADADKDGKLTRQEFLTSPRGKAPNDPEVTFPASDVNGDGTVSKAEWVSLQGVTVVTQAPAAPPK